MKPNLFARTISGGIILGFTGGVIGYYLGELGSILLGTISGILLGSFVGRLGAGMFFVSIITGAILLGLIGFRIGGWDMMEICAGTGGAMGGFIGIVIENYYRRANKNEYRFMDPGFFK